MAALAMLNDSFNSDNDSFTSEMEKAGTDFTEESEPTGFRELGIPLDSQDSFARESNKNKNPDETLDYHGLDSFLSDDEPEPIPDVFTGPPPQRAGNKKKCSAKTWVVGFLILVCIALAGAWYERAEIVNRWPAAADILTTLHIPLAPIGAGLKVSALQAERSTQNGDEILLVKGIITNTTANLIDVPKLTLSLFDASNTLLQESVGTASKDTLASGESVGFKLQLKQPSQSAQRFEVGFFTAKNAKPIEPEK